MVRVDDLIKDVRPGFGLRKKRILDGISFRVREREIFGFIGPNGAGKTTTLKVLMGLIRATSGKASILGHDVSEVTFRRQIGFLPEQPYFYDYLTGREILRFYAKLSGVSQGRRERRVTELLELVGLSADGNTRLRSYSKGMLQRIGIAQALVHDPQVVFLDEPMSGLDPV
ncbi:MAG: ABC transporter ATP-binding protein, partial [Myxococcales bacterium]|nr:ABC transporter ATP-binding protein [Myxococcales bacterium]